MREAVSSQTAAHMAAKSLPLGRSTISVGFRVVLHSDSDPNEGPAVVTDSVLIWVSSRLVSTVSLFLCSNTILNCQFIQKLKLVVEGQFSYISPTLIPSI